MKLNSTNSFQAARTNDDLKDLGQYEDVTKQTLSATWKVCVYVNGAPVEAVRAKVHLKLQGTYWKQNLGSRIELDHITKYESSPAKIDLSGLGWPRPTGLVCLIISAWQKSTIQTPHSAHQSSPDHVRGPQTSVLRSDKCYGQRARSVEFVNSRRQRISNAAQDSVNCAISDVADSDQIRHEWH
jgi:hypothetical protein